LARGEGKVIKGRGEYYKRKVITSKASIDKYSAIIDELDPQLNTFIKTTSGM